MRNGNRRNAQKEKRDSIIQKKGIGVIFLSILLVSFFMSLFQSIAFSKEAYCISAAVESDFGDYSYLGINTSRDSYIYKVDYEGKVKSMKSIKKKGTKDLFIEDIGFYQDELYVFASYYATEEKKRTFCVYRFDEDLHLNQTIKSDNFDAHAICSKLYLQDDTITMVMLDQTRQSAKVYGLDLYQVQDGWYEIISEAAVKNRFFMEAIYDGDELQARYDNGSYVRFLGDQNERLSEDSNLLIQKEEAVNQIAIKKPSVLILWRGIRYSWFQNLFLLFGILVTLLIIAMLLRGKAYQQKQFACMEIGMITLFVIAELLFAVFGTRYVTNLYLKRVDEKIASFQQGFEQNCSFFQNVKQEYRAEDYSEVYLQLISFQQQLVDIKDIVLLHSYDGNEQIMVALNGKQKKQEQAWMTKEVKKLADAANDTQERQYKVMSFLGKEAVVFALPIGKSGENSLLIYMDLTDVQDMISYIRTIGTRIGLLIICLLSGVAWFITQRMKKDLDDYGKAMVSVLEGKPIVEGSKGDTVEINRLWELLTEIVKRYEKVNFAQIKVLRSYHRFAPKKMDQILGRQSIFEVQNGEYGNVKATVASFRWKQMDGLSKQQRGHNMQQVYSAIAIETGKYGGNVIDRAVGQGTTKIIFAKEPEKALRFGIDLFQDLYRNMMHIEKVSMLLHYSSWEYGIAGSENDLFFYLNEEDSNVKEECINHLQRLEAGLVVTDSWDWGLEIGRELRVIGSVAFQNSEDKKRYRLMQVLPACSKEMRNGILLTMQEFHLGIEAFEDKDYYHARRYFGEVMKENPQDLIASWYVSQCEYRLSQAERDGIQGILMNARVRNARG